MGRKNRQTQQRQQTLRPTETPRVILAIGALVEAIGTRIGKFHDSVCGSSAESSSSSLPTALVPKRRLVDDTSWHELERRRPLKSSSAAAPKKSRQFQNSKGYKKALLEHKKETAASSSSLLALEAKDSIEHLPSQTTDVGTEFTVLTQSTYAGPFGVLRMLNYRVSTDSTEDNSSGDDGGIFPLSSMASDTYSSNGVHGNANDDWDKHFANVAAIKEAATIKKAMLLKKWKAKQPPLLPNNKKTPKRRKAWTPRGNWHRRRLAEF